MDRAIEGKKGWNRWIKPVVLGVTGLLVIGLLIRNGSRSGLNVNKGRLIVQTVDTGDFKEFVPVSGEVLPVNTYYLDAVEGGIVDKVFVESGVQVSQNEPIIKLSNTSLELNYMTQQTQIMEQINNMSNTRISVEEQTLNLQEQLMQTDFELQKMEREYKVNKQLLQDSVIARNAFADIRDEYEHLVQKKALIEEKLHKDSILRKRQISQLEPSIDMMQRNLEYIDRALDNLIVKAPVDGQLTALRVLPGQSVNKGERIAQIDDMSAYKIRATIDEHYIDKLQPGLTATYREDGRDYELTIDKIYPEVDEGNFEVDMIFKIEAPEKLKRGQSLQMRVELSAARKALLLPKGAYYQQTGGKWVYVLSENGDKAFKREIKVGRQNPVYYELREGLQPGDRVITSSYKSFNERETLNLK